MGLRAVLVDQGFIQHKTRTVGRVGGRKLYKEGEGTAFRCRLELTGAPERKQEGMARTDVRPHLLTSTKDSEGNPLEFLSSQVIRVVSAALGEALWQVNGDPEPLRKRRSLIGWRLDLHRVNEPTPEEP